MQFITGNDRHQTYFTTLEEKVSADNPARLMDAFIDKLDLAKMGFINSVHKNEGRPPYAPAVLLKLYLYGYLNKIRSSRKLERECSRNIELQWLLQNLAPNYHTIADFRKLHGAQLECMFRLYVQFLGDAGLLPAAEKNCRYNAQSFPNASYSAANTRVPWTRMTTTSNKTHIIINEGRPSASIRLAYPYGKVQAS